MYRFYQIDSCKTGSLAVKELAKGHWQSLETLTIGNFIIMEIEVLSNLEIRRVDSWQICVLKN
jgi:hypothetical protein